MSEWFKCLGIIWTNFERSIDDNFPTLSSLDLTLVLFRLRTSNILPYSMYIRVSDVIPLL